MLGNGVKNRTDNYFPNEYLYSTCVERKEVRFGGTDTGTVPVRERIGVLNEILQLGLSIHQSSAFFLNHFGENHST